MALFGILNIVIFAMLQSGSRSFNIATSRSTLQGELNRSLARLQGEVRRSSASLLSVVTDPARRVDGQRRDGISLSSLRDWQAAASYGANGDPLWNEFNVYYATRETPGRLLRRTYHPPGATPYQTPMAGFASAMLVDNPTGTEVTVLAQHLEEFKLQYDGGASALKVELLLRRRAGRTPEGRRVNEERVQATCQLRVANP